MRPLLLALATVLAGCAAPRPAPAQPADGRPSLLVRTERAGWEKVGSAVRRFDRVSDLDPTESLDERLRRVRRRAYQAALVANTAVVLLQVVSGLRHERGDAIYECADEDAAIHALVRLRALGDDLVEMDATTFSDEEPFDAARIAAVLDEHLAPLHALVARHADAPEDVCAAAPEPGHAHDDEAP